MPSSHQQLLATSEAVVFGDGVHGLKGTAGLDTSNSFPDANVVFLIALGLYAASPFVAAWWSSLLLARNALLTWFGAGAGAGALCSQSPVRLDAEHYGHVLS